MTNKCRLFAIDDKLKAVVENGLYSKFLIGETMSVSVVKFTLPKGPEIAASAHAHGEEVSLQIRGGCNVFQGADDKPPENTVVLNEGTVMMMPARESHWGDNRYDEGGVSMRLNVVTPPRAEAKSEDATPYYPMKTR